MKVDVPSFDGNIDATVFSDWLVAMEDYFDWYEMSDIERVRFAKRKLVGLARKFWHTITSHLERIRQPLIEQWEVMKDGLKEKYIPSFHRTHLVDQMLDLRQSSSCVSHYINAFEELFQRYELLEGPYFTTARFIRGLRSDLKRDVTLSSPFTLDKAYHRALKVQKLNKHVSMRRSTFLTRPPTRVAHKPPQVSASASNVRTSSLTAPSPSPSLLVPLEPHQIRPYNALIVGEEVIMLPSVLIACLS